MNPAQLRLFHNGYIMGMVGSYSGHDRQCVGKSKHTGNRCNKLAMRGTTVCRVHGGASPQVREAARRRLESLVHPAISTLKRVIEDSIDDGDTPSAVRASVAVLDRSGFHPTQSIEVTGRDGGPIEIANQMPFDKLPLELRVQILEAYEKWQMENEVGEDEGNGNVIDVQAEKRLIAEGETDGNGDNESGDPIEKGQSREMKSTSLAYLAE